MSVKKPSGKVPGSILIQEKQCKDIKTLSYRELMEIKERQCKLLSFKNRLPDKGKLLEDSYAKLLEEIQKRNEVDATAAMFSELNIAKKGKTVLNNLEWNYRRFGGSQATDDSSHVGDILDSDDEQECDPLRMIAQRTMHQRQVKILPPPATLITENDLKDIASFKERTVSPDSAVPDNSDESSTSDPIAQKTIVTDLIEIDARVLVSKQQPAAVELDQHALFLIEKTEVQPKPATREKFKPFRTTLSNVHDPDKERGRKMGKHWEVTAATPPLIKHKEAQLLSLSESANLQTEYMGKIKALRLEQAEKRLAQQQNRTSLCMPDESVIKTKSAFQTYRDPQAYQLIEGRQSSQELKLEKLDPLHADL